METNLNSPEELATCSGQVEQEGRQQLEQQVEAETIELEEEESGQQATNLTGKLRDNLRNFFENGIVMFDNNFIMGIMEDISKFKADNAITYDTRQKLNTIVNNIMYFLELGSDNEFSLFYMMAAWDKAMSDPYARNSWVTIIDPKFRVNELGMLDCTMDLRDKPLAKKYNIPIHYQNYYDEFYDGRRNFNRLPKPPSKFVIHREIFRQRNNSDPDNGKNVKTVGKFGDNPDSHSSPRTYVIENVQTVLDKEEEQWNKLPIAFGGNKIIDLPSFSNTNSSSDNRNNRLIEEIEEVKLEKLRLLVRLTQLEKRERAVLSQLVDSIEYGKCTPDNSASTITK